MTEESGLGNPGPLINYKYLFLKFTKDVHVIKVYIGRNEKRKKRGKTNSSFPPPLSSPPIP
jgi:hypothetical protein